ncbi:MAG: GH3 auxin-responsive promoter family protein [Atopobiaceae bacterium]|nr:GH3 auxin-responsive promoter family protein [Atopobiaceae bacterium]
MGQNDYKISVITPFHNVDLDMFRVACDSVMSQTIGFENIQWIVVLHNCEEHYLTEVPAMFEGYDNVLTPVLNNDAKTPSSPRNHGLTFATAPYIAFLDGDDSFTPHCFEAVLNEFQRSNSQIVCFRREYELERPGLEVYTETVLWNQANERIIVEKENWDVEKMFDGVFGMVTSKAYDRVFLISNNLIFDEDIPYAEDMAYVAQAFAAADKICYLPQLIGYHYYVNGASLVQSTDKDGATLISYAKGFAKLFDMFLQYGIDTDDVQGLCLRESFFILNSKAITAEERGVIRDILAPYILDTKMLEPSKGRDLDACHMLYYIPREVILNPDDPYSGPHVRSMQNGSNALFKILLDNMSTDYGEKFSFKTLKTIDAYRFRVPLSTADTLKPLIALQTNIGEQNILTSSPIQNYFTTEYEGLLLPSTQPHFLQYVNALSETLAHKKSALFAAIHNTRRMTNDQAVVSDIETTLVRNLINDCIPSHPEYEIHFSSKEGVYYSYEDDELYMRLMADALLSSDLEQLVAFTTDKLAHAFALLYEQQEAVLALVREKDPVRADEVKEILSQNSGTPIARALWPRLERTVAYGAGEMYESMRRMRSYTGDLPHNHGYLYSPVALLGRAVSDDSDLFSMSAATGSNFYELLPISDDGSGNQALTLSEAEHDKPYQLVVTNQAGLYRYVTDHFICVKEVDFSSVRFTIY